MATKRVSGSVTNLVVTRDGNDIKVEWKNPGYLFDETRDDYATWLDANVDFHRENCRLSSGQVWETSSTSYEPQFKPLSYTGFDYNWVKGLGKATSFDKPYDRNRFHPIQDRCYCKLVQVKVHGGNDSGVGGADPDSRTASGRGPDAVFNWNFEQPKAPEAEITGWDSSNNYAAAYSVKTEFDDKSAAEAYDTVYRTYRQDNIPGSGYGSRKALTGWTSTKLAEATGSIQSVSQLLALPDGQWVEYTLEAYSRGMWGDGPKSTSKILASRPAKAVITGISVSNATDGIVTVSVRIPSDAHRWTTKAKLQRVKDVDPDKTASELGNLSWEDVSGMMQIDEKYKNATFTTGFSDSVTSAKPQVNKRTWYRVVTENALYTGNSGYISTPFEARQLYREQTASDDSVFVESLTTNDDATAVRVLLGWPDDDSSGTEVSWSDKPDAWESSEQPSTAQVEWEDATSQGTHAHSAMFTIYGVEQGQKVYVKARRYVKGSDGNVSSYGPYATASTGGYPYIPAMPPTDVRLSAPAYVPRGDDVSLTWTFQSEAQQTAWAVYLVMRTVSNNVTTTVKTALASGEDAFGACTIPAGMFSSDTATLLVSMTTGSTWADSDEVTVRFADPPVIEAALPSTTKSMQPVSNPTGDPSANGYYEKSGSSYVESEDTEVDTSKVYYYVVDDELPLIRRQPAVLYCSSDTGDDLLRVRVVSNGVTVDAPDGDMRQLAGDVVWDAYIAPTWVSDGGRYYTAVSLPEGLDLHDVGIYSFDVTGVNEITGLQSQTRTVKGRVRWEHQAHQPGQSSSVTVLESDRSALVTPTAPDNAEATDVFDLYRVTADGVSKIAEGLEFGSSALDRRAPFGRFDTMYRVCTRTKDGDMAWRDVPYALNCSNLRIDWEDKSIELPYNLVREDSWNKDFEERAHLDGERSGYWNKGASRKATLSTDLVKSDSERQNSLRDLARSSCPVFVRLPNGCAYQANVDVNKLSENYGSAAIPVSLDVTQVALTDEYKVASGDISYPTTAGGEESYDKMAILSWNATCPDEGDAFSIPDEPSAISVHISTSAESYMDEYAIDATFSGDDVTLGAFSEELLDHLDEVAGEGVLYLLTCDYTVEVGDE